MISADEKVPEIVEIVLNERLLKGDAEARLYRRAISTSFA